MGASQSPPRTSTIGKHSVLQARHRVLIVGGGPVGLATALTLATAGVPVVVVEKGTWPQDKVCGEGVMPTGVDFLQRFGVLAHLPADQSWPFRGIRYREPNGIIAEADFASGPGLGIRRLALSHALAATLAGYGARRDLTVVLNEASQCGAELFTGRPAEAGPRGVLSAGLLTLVAWRGGRATVEVLARTGPHGQWLEWVQREYAYAPAS